MLSQVSSFYGFSDLPRAPAPLCDHGHLDLRLESIYEIINNDNNNIPLCPEILRTIEQTSLIKTVLTLLDGLVGSQAFDNRIGGTPTNATTATTDSRNVLLLLKLCDARGVPQRYDCHVRCLTES